MSSSSGPLLSGGSSFSLFLHQNGSIYGTGANDYGQLGLGFKSETQFLNTASGVQEGLGNVAKITHPTASTILPPIRAISAGGRHSLFIDLNGQLWGCGDNDSGQLGINNQESVEQHESSVQQDEQVIPVVIPGFDQLPLVGISAGDDYSLALDQLGQVWAFGSNESGQLGLGHYETLDTPTLIPELSGIIRIAAGRNHSLFLDQDGQVWACGESFEPYPQIISDLPTITEIAVGGQHSLLLDNLGQVWTFGSNEYGQLGLGDFEDRSEPTQIINLPPIAQIKAGDNFSLMVSSSGLVWSCGLNYHGQLGYPTNPYQPNKRNIPTLIAGLPPIKLISAGSDFALAMDYQGKLWGFGSNDEHQLGINSSSSPSSRYQSEEEDYNWPVALPLTLLPQPTRTTYTIFEHLLNNNQVQDYQLLKDGRSIEGGDVELKFSDQEGNLYIATVEFQPQIYPSVNQTNGSMFKHIEKLLAKEKIRDYRMRPDLMPLVEKPPQLVQGWAEFTDDQSQQYLLPIQYRESTNEIFKSDD